MMMFDEKDLRVFETSDEKEYFQEILQSYYCKNYRASVVLLYSLVIYDLFEKLKIMAHEGDEKSKNKLQEIKGMISDDEKYSKVESYIILFFKENYSLHFDKFFEDIDYLKKCRNKCAHLKVNDNSLFIPNDYQTKMLICSMYDNVLSAKAPFIMDLFDIAKQDIELYSGESYLYSTESLGNDIESKYLVRMTYKSLVKSLRTFIKLLFVSEDDNARNNAQGLYIFTSSMLNYIQKNGYSRIYAESSIEDIFSKIKVDTIKKDPHKVGYLANIVTNFPDVMSIIRNNEEVYNHIASVTLSKIRGLQYYKSFHPEPEKTTYTFFLESNKLHRSLHINELYDTLKDEEDFNLFKFISIMFDSIPPYGGFSAANAVMSFFTNHLEDLEIDNIKKLRRKYQKNDQVTNRRDHDQDDSKIEEYIKEHEKNNTLDQME